MDRADEPLRDPARLLAELERIASLGTWIIHTGGAVIWSPGAYALLGVDPSVREVNELAQAFHERVHPDDRARVMEAQVALLREGKLPPVEYRIVRPDGEVRWLRGHGSVVWGANGENLGSLGALVDITETRRAMARLEQARWALEESQRVSQVGTFVFNLTTGQLEWSDEARRLVGLAREEPVDAAVADSFNHPEDKASLQVWSTRVLDGEAVGPHRSRVVRRDGQVRWVEHSAAVRESPDGSKLLVGTSRDITERLQLEAQLRHTTTLEAVGTLAAGVAHDVNNALTVISNSLAMLERRVNEGDIDLVRDAARAVEGCSTLTQQLLAFARRQPSVPRVLDANALLGGFTQMIRRVLRPDIALSVEALDEPAWVRIDPSQLEAALMNLAVNARDAMPDGGILTFRVAGVDAEAARPADVPAGVLVRLDVEDTGQGIPPESLGHIFQPYFTTKVASKGTGLGLASVFGTLQQHGGAVTVRSTLGQGACFSLWLPRELEGPPSETAPRIQPGASRATVLVVDDMELVRRSTCRMLRSAGYAVLEASSGREALEVLAAGERVDVVLSDLLMPGMDGRELALAARAVGRGQPFIFVTGYADADAGLDTLGDLGRVLLKPFSPERLFSVVEDALAASRGPATTA
ncbi:MAG: PAS domain-containing protein [Myxococcota bacterium]